MRLPLCLKPVSTETMSAETTARLKGWKGRLGGPPGFWGGGTF